MSDDRSSEGHRVRVVIRLQTPSVSSDDTHSLQLSEGERVVNGQAVSSDTSSAEFQAQLDEEVDREFQFDEGPLEMAREAKLVTMVADATHVRTHRHRIRSVLRRVLRFKPWKWRSLVGVRREVKMPRGPRGSNEEQTPLVGQEEESEGSNDSDEMEIQQILSDFSEGWLESDDEDGPEGGDGVGLLVPMQVN